MSEQRDRVARLLLLIVTAVTMILLAGSVGSLNEAIRDLQRRVGQLEEQVRR